MVRTRPADGDNAASVYDTAAINADISSAAGGVDAASLTSRSVYLTDLSTGERVLGTPSTSGGGDTITLALDAELTDGTEYQFDVTSGVRAGDGTLFVAYTSTFVTAGAGTENPAQPSDAVLAFQKTSEGVRHSSLTVGPDGNLYASAVDGSILRYPIAEDGSPRCPRDPDYPDRR